MVLHLGAWVLGKISCTTLNSVHDGVPHLIFPQDLVLGGSWQRACRLGSHGSVMAGGSILSI